MASKLDRIDPKLLHGNPRATLNSWLRYEKIVEQAFSVHPRAFSYRPLNRTAATVCSQLRDAVRGRLAFDYPSSIPTQDLLRWYSEVIFKHDNDVVYIGVPDQILETISGNGIVPESYDSTFRFAELTFEEVSAFYLLISTGRIKGPVQITTPPDLALLPERPNVEILNRPDGSAVLL